MTAPAADPQRGAWPDLIVAVVGPTATGKSELALDLAAALGAQIVNADAFAVYRGMDIGTAKTPLAERRGLVHHLIDVVDTDQDFDVQAYQSQGRAALAAIAGQAATAVVVGGSGLYVRALLDDLRFPGTDAGVRAKWQARADVVGPEELHQQLAALDPLAARAIHPGNVRRVVRALEVIELTGRPFQAALPKSGPALVPHIAVGVDCDRNVLDVRIAQRVESMMAQGFLEEVRELAARGLTGQSGAGRAVGYTQMLEHLEGRLSFEQAVTETVSATRKLARRQRRWFRADHRIAWLPQDRSLTDILAHLGVGASLGSAG